MEQGLNSEGDALTNSKTQSIVKLRTVLVGNNPGKCQLFDMLPTFVKGHKLTPPGSESFGAESEDWEGLKQFLPDAHMYTVIAVEHRVLAATALGLGTCWVQG